jgi:peptidylprolyl isomerase
MSTRKALAAFFTAVVFTVATRPGSLPAQDTASSTTAALETSTPQTVLAAASPESGDFVHPALRTDLASSITLPSGLVIKDITVGTGEEATTGMKCLVHYVMWVNDNPKRHQSSRHEIVPRPFSLELGQGQTIAGFNMAIQGMRAGGRRVVSIPPALGYGATTQGAGIPPNSTLHYDLELVGLKQGAAANTPAVDDAVASAPL